MSERSRGSYDDALYKSTYTLTQRSRSHGYENHGRMVASDHVPYSAYAAVLPVAIAGKGLHVDTPAYVF